jgi:hypothetical protein
MSAQEIQRNGTPRTGGVFDFPGRHDYPPRPASNAGGVFLSGAIQLTLYSKSGCGLCEEAYDVVLSVSRALAGDRPSMLEVVDITTESALMARYRYDIPVLAIDGRPAFRHHVDPARLRTRLLDGTPAPLEEQMP